MGVSVHALRIPCLLTWISNPTCASPRTSLLNPQKGAPLQLYDTWVTRDAAGGHALKLPPYLAEPAGGARLAAGLPAPVACCWNGLAVLDAAPLRGGLRMRCAPLVMQIAWN